MQIHQAENSEFSDAIKKGARQWGIDAVTNALFENAYRRSAITQPSYLLSPFIRAGLGKISQRNMNVKDEEKTITLRPTRIGINELTAIEASF